jgi:hypothetical protein
MLTEEFKKEAMDKLEESNTDSMVKTLESIGSVRITKEKQWITKAIQLLKQMEFSGTITEYDESYDGSLEPWETTRVCPICECQGYHSDLCELQELLEEAKGIE